jgi:hypothetical protein
VSFWQELFYGNVSFLFCSSWMIFNMNTYRSAGKLFRFVVLVRVAQVIDSQSMS